MNLRLTVPILAALLLLPALAPAQEAGADEPAAAQAAAEEATSTTATGRDEAKPGQAAPGADPDQPRTMSGMSILGNEEAPKALVIVPWKSSELADDLTLSDTLDDRARPVDREVFLRELDYFRLRSGQ